MLRGSFVQDLLRMMHTMASVVKTDTLIRSNFEREDQNMASNNEAEVSLAKTTRTWAGQFPFLIYFVPCF
jgi:hypothetical protein